MDRDCCSFIVVLYGIFCYDVPVNMASNSTEGATNETNNSNFDGMVLCAPLFGHERHPKEHPAVSSAGSRRRLALLAAGSAFALCCRCAAVRVYCDDLDLELLFLSLMTYREFPVSARETGFFSTLFQKRFRLCGVYRTNHK